jgi:hypothetical protein
MDTSKGLRLTIELVPSPCWYSNLRSSMTRANWDKLRKSVYAEYNYHCGVCQTSDVTLHCHEIWQYDDENHIQNLTGFIALCEMCHHCKHIGLAGILASEGKLDFGRVIEHFMQVNQCSREEYQAHEKQAWDVLHERSMHYDWTTDVETYAYLVAPEAGRRLEQHTDTSELLSPLSGKSNSLSAD